MSHTDEESRALPPGAGALPRNDVELTRRDAIKTLAAGIGAAVIVPLVPRAAGAATPGPDLKFLTPGQHHTVDALAEAILPADDRSPGARAARVADYIDFALSESTAQTRAAWTDGLAALDAASVAQFGKPFADAAADQQTTLLTAVAANEFAPTTPLESFFQEAKSKTIFGYYTSEIGIHQELKYKGNQYLPEFVGCDHPEHLA